MTADMYTTTTATTTSSGNDEGLTNPQIIGIAVGVGIPVILLIGYAIYLYTSPKAASTQSSQEIEKGRQSELAPRKSESAGRASTWNPLSRVFVG